MIASAASYCTALLVVLHSVTSFQVLNCKPLHLTNGRITDNKNNAFTSRRGSPPLPRLCVATTQTLADQVREDFPILHGSNNSSVYLDSGATSHKPTSVLKALSDFYTQYNSNVHRGAHQASRQATAAYEEARGKIAEFIGAESREIVFSSGATAAVNLVAQTYGRQHVRSESDEMVLTVVEHHANLVPWQLLAQETSCSLRFAPLDADGGLNVTAFTDLLSPATKIVALQHVSNVLGCTHDIDAMVQAVRKKAAPDCVILLDACQSVPHQPVNVQELGVDFLVASGHKMCGPTGIGFLWGKYELLETMPPWQGGGEMIDTVSITDGCTWQAPPARFEAGTPPIAQAIALGTAVDYLQSVGMDRIAAYEHELGQYLYDQLSTVPGITVLGPTRNRSALCAFVHDTIHPSDLSAFLDMDGIAIRAGHHCCQPLHTALGHSHSARASAYMYNTRDEVDAFIVSLRKTINFFASATNSHSGSGSDDFVPFV